VDITDKVAKISQLLLQSGFVLNKEMPAYQSQKPVMITINNLRFRFVTSVYMDIEAMTINGCADVLYKDIVHFNAGGISRIGENPLF